MIYVIGNKKLSVAIDGLGAEINSVKKTGKEMIWQNEDGSWDGHAPLIFPHCGTLTLKADGVKYPRNLHGFAKNMTFLPEKQTETEIFLTLNSNADTLKLYPFDFSLTIHYSVKNTTLNIETIVKNIGKNTMYFATGGHESFVIDKSIDNYYIEFEKEESLLRLYHNDSGVLNGKEQKYPTSKFLKFSENPIKNSETLIYKDINSSYCKLVENNGKILAEIHFNGFKNILFWKTDSGKFICIEPWQNLPDTENIEPEEISKTSGFNALASGKSASIKRKIIY